MKTLDLLVLSRLSTLSEVARYSGAQHYVLPVLMSLSAVGGTFYPVLSGYWSNARRGFEEAFQHGIDSVMVLAGMAVCVMLTGAEFSDGPPRPRLRVRGASSPHPRGGLSCEGAIPRDWAGALRGQERTARLLGKGRSDSAAVCELLFNKSRKNADASTGVLR